MSQTTNPVKFEIIVPTAPMGLAASRVGEVVVDVTSRLDRNTRVGIQLLPDAGATPEWFGPADPLVFDSQVGQTRQVRVPIHVPLDAPAGATSVRVRAFAEDNPGADYAESAPIAINVPEVPKEGGIPSWLIALVAVLVFVLVGGGAYLLLRDKSVDIAGVVGQTLAEARGNLDEDLEVLIFTDDTVTEASAETDGCVLLQIPPGGQTSVKVALLVTDCPRPGPQLPALEVLDDVCAVNGFCAEIREHFGELTDNENWDDTRTAQFTEFVETFTEDGVISPELVGTPVDATLSLDDLDLRYVSEGKPGAQCVLFQYPPPLQEIRKGSVVTSVLVPCPSVDLTVDRVSITTDIDLNAYANICDLDGPDDFCRAVGNDDLRPSDFVGSASFVALLEAQERTFRQTFTKPMVPTLSGLTETEASALLAVVDLELKVTQTFYVAVAPGVVTFNFCNIVTAQSPAPGTELDDVPGSTVNVTITVRPDIKCSLLVPIQIGIFNEAVLLESESFGG